ncbi:hypothetical protein, partial [Enterococcus faecium]|uniref:hypothetical protein n=1 Tax=Enterococcus faecium TaxID=1352 RepID=UPI001C4E2F1C
SLPHADNNSAKLKIIGIVAITLNFFIYKHLFFIGLIYNFILSYFYSNTQILLYNVFSCSLSNFYFKPLNTNIKAQNFLLEAFRA